MGLTVHEAGIDDLAQIVSLWQELAEYHIPLGPDFEISATAPDLFRTKMAETIQKGDELVLVADEGGRLVGFMTGAVRETAPVFAQRTIGYVSNAIVTRSHRRRGVGESLYLKLVEWFRGRGVSTVELSTASANTSGLNFWHKMGFKDHMIHMRSHFK